MKRNKIFLYVLTSMILVIGPGCKKYLDVNQNLNDPTVVPVSTLLTGSELAIGNNLSLGGLSSGLSVYMHQKTTRGAADQYGMTGDNGAIENPWYGLYGALKNLNVIISQGTTESRFKYVGVAKILKAYAFSQMVDVWGDIPFSEFDQFKTGILQPKFDDDAAIYPQLLTMLDAGIADIKNATVNPSSPAGDDLIYSGNMTRWEKAANTIKLKLYTQIRKVQNVTPQVTALLASPATLIASNADMFVLPYGPLGATDDRNPGYGDYTVSQRGQNVSPWFYEIMKGYSPMFGGTYPNVFPGITDPRIPYYWYNQKNAVTAGENRTEYRDRQFISIIFGSIGPDRNGSQQNSYTLFGIYPVGGRYDDGAGISIGSGSGQITSLAAGTGAAPHKFITYADRLYLEAELINTGVVPGNAATVFQNAVTNSISQVDYIITTYVKPTQTVPVLATQPAATSYIASIMALFNAGSNAKQLEYIITQKWIASFGSSVDQYTDYRRTGYPVLFDPRNTAMAPGGFVQPPVNGNPTLVPQAKVAVTRSNEFPLSLPWPKSELEINSNAPMQKPLPIVYKVFWMP
ncbi:MAG: SusD/RagB family nutrient-binding outer membrane lipoprotein [Chitinophagaceae bacterium]|nr:SusD/RagB family nutrient-binding outer membrane lipoprotein [Chitinophagaceae bacterium]